MDERQQREQKSGEPRDEPAEAQIEDLEPDHNAAKDVSGGGVRKAGGEQQDYP